MEYQMILVIFTSLLSPKDKTIKTATQEKYIKKINRLLYRLNENITEMPEYREYKGGKINDYPEGNITDVTHSFVLALNIFMFLLQTNRKNKSNYILTSPLDF